MNKIELDITPRPALRTTQKSKYLPKSIEYEQYKTALRWLCKKNGYELEQVLKIIFVLPVADGITGKKRAERIGQFHTQKPDIDNLIKGFMDCFGKDDSFVHTLHARKIWGEKGKIVLVFD